MAFSFWNIFLRFRGICGLYYPNEECDDVINSSTAKYWIKNISRNIGAVFFKLGTGNEQHKRNRMTLRSCHNNTPGSFCEKPNILICNLLEWDRASCALGLDCSLRTGSQRGRKKIRRAKRVGVRASWLRERSEWDAAYTAHSLLTRPLSARPTRPTLHSAILP